MAHNHVRTGAGQAVQRLYFTIVLSLLIVSELRLAHAIIPCLPVLASVGVVVRWMFGRDRLGLESVSMYF